MRQEVVTLGLQDVVISAGHLPYGQLPWLYENADIYAYPSFCESFGHPLLEAMAYGLPIIAANTAVNREVAGDASLYFDMFNPESCASGLIKLMSDTTLRRTMTERGRRIVATHPWSTHVSSLLSALSTLIADRIRS
jgi:glycosyltransferase involved in cell wall biosynthesis